MPASNDFIRYVTVGPNTVPYLKISANLKVLYKLYTKFYSLTTKLSYEIGFTIAIAPITFNPLGFNFETHCKNPATTAEPHLSLDMPAIIPII